MYVGTNLVKLFPNGNKMNSFFSAFALALTANHRSHGSICSADDNEMISRLKFIGRINKEEKIDSAHVCVQPNNMVTSVSRTFFGSESKETTYSFIRITIDRAFSILDNYNKKEKNPASFPEYNNMMKQNLIQDLRNAVGGLENIKSTYRDYIKFCCDLDTIIQEIRGRTENLVLE